MRALAAASRQRTGSASATACQPVRGQLPGDGRCVGPFGSDGDHVAGDAAADLLEQAARHGAHGHARRRLAGAGALDDVAQVLRGRRAARRPGRRAPAAGTRTGSAGCAGGSTSSTPAQLAASRFWMTSAMGAPVVRP